MYIEKKDSEVVAKLSRRSFVLMSAAAASMVACKHDATLAATPTEAEIKVIPTRVYPAPDAPDGLFPVTYRKLLPITAPRARYPGFAPGRTLLKAGTIRREGARPLTCNIIFERDVALKLRDGTTIYTDIFRPEGDAKVPAIFSWSPYGKELGGQWLDDLPGRSGVPLHLVSELQRFEGADPAYWCAHGYAVVNPDPRGALRSEGNVTYWGRQLAEDGYDVIEWIATQPWNSGAVVMSGNSWLAVSQWFTAAEQPPHLRAIAPWEGLTNAGPTSGIPAGAVFGEIIIQTLAGNGYIEDQPRMTLGSPIMNAYWNDRRARLERVEVPAYVVASYTNMAHTYGTFDGFRLISSKEKWLRVHNTQEWTDYYQPEHVEDLRRFFDHYTKGAANGWETTPKVRMAILDPGHTDILNRAEENFPPERVRFTKLYLDPKSSTLSREAAANVTVTRYKADRGSLNFRVKFDRDTELTGYMNLRLWVEAEGSDDMDLAVEVQKVQGAPHGLSHFLRPPGAPSDAITTSGLLRVSMRELDQARSAPERPVLSLRKEERLTPGQIVPVDIGIWPMAMLYHAGEELELTIRPFSFPPMAHMPFSFGHAKVPIPENQTTFTPGEKVPLRQMGGPTEESATRLTSKLPPSRNKGTHILHTGGQYESYLLVSEV